MSGSKPCVANSPSPHIHLFLPVLSLLCPCPHPTFLLHPCLSAQPSFVSVCPSVVPGHCLSICPFFLHLIHSSNHCFLFKDISVLALTLFFCPPISHTPINYTPVHSSWLVHPKSQSLTFPLSVCSSVPLSWAPFCPSQYLCLPSPYLSLFQLGPHLCTLHLPSCPSHHHPQLVLISLTQSLPLSVYLDLASFLFLESTKPLLMLFLLLWMLFLTPAPPPTAHGQLHLVLQISKSPPPAHLLLPL